MKNEIIIKTYKVDWLKIIKLALNKKEWGKTYTLYKINNTVLSCSMKSFNFIKNKAIFILSLNYKDNIYSSNTKEIDYYLSNFTILDFTMHLNKSIRSLFNNCIEYELDKKGKNKINYDDRYIYSWGISVKLIKKHNLKEFEKIKSIENDDLQESLLSNLQSFIAKKVNKPLMLELKDYILTHSFEIEGFNRIKKSIEKDVDKNE